MEDLQHLDYWKCCSELSIAQAALLAIEIDPASNLGDRCESSPVGERPVGYEAIKTAIIQAVKKGVIPGHITPFYEQDINGNCGPEIPGSIDPKATLLELDALCQWFRQQHKQPRFFCATDSAEKRIGMDAGTVNEVFQDLHETQLALKRAEHRAEAAEAEVAKLRAEIAAMESKPFDPRERATFERLIYVLALEAGYKLQKPSADEALIQEAAARRSAIVPKGKGPIANKLTAAIARFKQDRQEAEASKLGSA